MSDMQIDIEKLDIQKLHNTGVSESLERKALHIALMKKLVLVSKKPRIYVYLDANGDHILVDKSFCSCEGFLRNVGRGEIQKCSHIRAVEIAEDVGRYRTFLLGGVELSRVVWEVLTGGLTFTLRRIMAEREHEN